MVQMLAVNNCAGCNNPGGVVVASHRPSIDSFGPVASDFDAGSKGAVFPLEFSPPVPLFFRRDIRSHSP
jgi:hypothetical protein